MIELVIENNRTQILNVSNATLKLLDNELKYPTSLATDAAQAASGTNWDGWIRLLRTPQKSPPWFPSGLIPRVSRILSRLDIPHELKDARRRPEDAVPEWPKAELCTREYQQEAVRLAIEQGRGVLDMPPRSGKTRVGLDIVAKLGLPTIWIAPTDAIVRQTVSVFEQFFGSNFVHHQQGSQGLVTDDPKKLKVALVELERILAHKVIVCTAATASSLHEDFFATREVMVLDECHHMASKTYHEIAAKASHIFYRYGMTGTNFRSGDDDMAMHALLSNVIYKITPEELRAQGILVPTKVVYIPVDAPRLRCPQDSGRKAPWIKYGIEEHEQRNQLVAYCAAVLHNLGKKVVVLVRTKVQGRRLESLICAQIPKKAHGARFNVCEFVSTDRRREQQTAIFKAFNESHEVRVLIGTSMVGEGVDLPPATALVYARGEKAEVSLMQNAYRVCTALDGKKESVIVDFADRHSKRLLAHSVKRMKVFNSEPVFDVEVLSDAKNFVSWSRNLGVER